MLNSHYVNFRAYNLYDGSSNRGIFWTFKNYFPHTRFYQSSIIYFLLLNFYWFLIGGLNFENGFNDWHQDDRQCLPQSPSLFIAFFRLFDILKIYGRQFLDFPSPQSRSKFVGRFNTHNLLFLSHTILILDLVMPLLSFKLHFL